MSSLLSHPWSAREPRLRGRVRKGSPSLTCGTKNAPWPRCRCPGGSGIWEVKARWTEGRNQARSWGSGQMGARAVCSALWWGLGRMEHVLVLGSSVGPPPLLYLPGKDPATNIPLAPHRHLGIYGWHSSPTCGPKRSH